MNNQLYFMEDDPIIDIEGIIIDRLDQIQMSWDWFMSNISFDEDKLDDFLHGNSSPSEKLFEDLAKTLGDTKEYWKTLFDEAERNRAF